MLGVNHLIELLIRTEPLLVAAPDSHASLAVNLAARPPDADVDPLTLFHDPARLVLAAFLRAVLEKMMARRGCEPSTLGAVADLLDE